MKKIHKKIDYSKITEERSLSAYPTILEDKLRNCEKCRTKMKNKLKSVLKVIISHSMLHLNKVFLTSRCISHIVE